MVGRPPFAVTVVRTAVAVHPVGVPAWGFGADFEIAAFALVPCVMMAPPLISFGVAPEHVAVEAVDSVPTASFPDRKSTRLNSSHLVISYAVFCLKKKP